MIMTPKNKKLAATATAASLAVSMLLGGTFAWQSVSQKAKNQADGLANPGGRLHDYFNGENKDVFVENFTDPDENGVPIYARIRLREYMEIGDDAGNGENPDRQVTVVGKTEDNDPQLDDTSTWIIHHPAEHAPQGGLNEDSPMHEYWDWQMGGKTVYMPTFNMDKNSLDSDINGTWEGPDLIAGPNAGAGGVDDRYEDYKTYVLTPDEEDLGSNLIHTVTDTEKYADGATSEGPVEHTAKETLEATVITMEDWMNGGAEIGPYWVYDVDGWAYWAQPIQPQEATGLLLSGISPQREPDEGWYYAIDVEAQMSTGGDWGTAGEGENGSGGTGFYEDGITDDGLHLLNKVSNRLPQVTYVGIPSEGGIVYVTAEKPHTLTANVLVKNPTGAPAETYVTWSFDEPEAQSMLSGDIFTATTDMVGKSYEVTATSNFDPTKSATAKVLVMPPEAEDVVEGELDGKWYVNFGDNTYKVINREDGSLSDFYCAGLDKIIGNKDDKSNVVVLDDLNYDYGQKFLGPNPDGSYWAMGKDGMLGTDDDIKVYGDPWPENITHHLADTITITAVNQTGDIKIKVGKFTNFTAKVTLNGEPVTNQKVNWSVSNNVSENTKITSDGRLFVGADEKVGTVLTITAESQFMTGLKTNIQVTVSPLDYEDLPDVTPGSMTTVFIDGVQWYVLAKDNGKALIWAAQPLGYDYLNQSSAQMTAHGFGSNDNWSASSLRSMLNSTWLEDTTILKQTAVQTDISTPKTDGHTVSKTEWTVTQDKVFLLSKQDLFGGSSDARDYTYGNQVLVPDVRMRSSAGMSWLRTPEAGYYSTGMDIYYYISGVSTDGTYKSLKRSKKDSNYIRPALWVTMNQDVSGT